MKKDPPATFCALAWVHRFTNIHGQIQVCCTGEEFHNNILDSAGRPFSMKEAPSDGEILNSGFMKALRKQMLAGRWAPICTRCRITEEAGGISRRMDENSYYRKEIPKLLENTKSNGAIPVEVRHADLRLGNLCNLACRMCHPSASTRWIPDWAQLYPESRLPLSEWTLKSPTWYQHPKFFEAFQSQLPTLDRLHFAGGEPLLIPEMLQILKLCVESGRSSSIELSYNTNLTILPKELKLLWPQFKAVKLLCSVDGFGELNDYIRYPSRWETIDKNLRLLDQNFKAFGLTEVIIATTVQIYNILNLESLFDYLAENMTNVHQIPKLIDLYEPTHYRTQVLPAPLKKLAARRLEMVLEKTFRRIDAGEIPREQTYLADSARSTLHFLNQEDRSRELENFLKEAHAKDKLRKQKLISVLPELSKLV